MANETAAPSLMTAAFGSEWAWYLHGHDERELVRVDDPDVLQWEKLWMRPVTAAEEEEFGEDLAWIECGEGTPGAEPYMGVKYAPV